MNCFSYAQGCLLAPLPPRTPERADPQVPEDHRLGAVKYGRVGAFYFYELGTGDAAFGIFDIEMSVQKLGRGRVRVEASAIGDGLQSCAGTSSSSPLALQLRAGTEILAEVEWRYGAVLCGCNDPLSLMADIQMSDEDFERIDMIVLPAVDGNAEPCNLVGGGV